MSLAVAHFGFYLGANWHYNNTGTAQRWGNASANAALTRRGAGVNMALICRWC